MRFALALSDIHAFHMTGLTPRGFRASTGVELQLNMAQAYLYECWQHFLQDPRLPDRIDYLFLLGDLVEGQNPSEEARFLSEVDPTFQARGVVELLKPIVDRVPRLADGTRQIWMCGGSRYHAGRGHAIEETVGLLLKAQRGNSSYYVKGHRVVYVDENTAFDLAHHQSVMMRYRSTPLEREVGFVLERWGRERRTVPKRLVIARGHVHVGYRAVVERNITAVSLPCWKIQDEYTAGGKVPNRYVPENLGALGWQIPDDPDEPLVVVPFLYDHPLEDVEYAKTGADVHAGPDA